MTMVVVRGRPRVGPAAYLAAPLRGLAFAGLMLAGLGLLIVLLVSVVLTAVGIGVFVLDRGLPAVQQWLLGSVVVVAGLGIGRFFAPPALVAVRRVANLTRRLAGEWCGVMIPEPYQPAPPADADGDGDGDGRKLSFPARMRWLLGDVATWRDLLWVTVNTVAGWILAVASPVLIGVGVVAFLIPVTSKAVPPAAFPGNTKPTLAILGFAMLATGVAAGPWLLRGYGLLARSMLAPPGHAELAQQVRHLAKTRTEVLDTGAAEIRRIERDLHDGAQARLVAMGMTLDAAGQIIDSNPDAARALLYEARDASVKALAELRSLVRGIHPPVLADRGLADAIQALALDSPMRIHLASDLYGRPPAPVESAAYFAVSELLANVSKHAEARETWIDIRYTDGMLRIGVTDNGHGGADPVRGSGLRGIERRLAAFDGILAISSPVGGPTAVTMEIPCELSLPKTSSS
jgi:signal transduction histidine kinase